jgi:hypothetical protein
MFDQLPDVSMKSEPRSAQRWDEKTDRPSQRTITHYRASKLVVNSLNRETHYLSLVEAQQLNSAAVAECEPFAHCGVNFEPVQLPSTDVEATVSLPAAVTESLRNLCSGPTEAPISAVSALSTISARRANRLQDLKYLAFGAMLTIVASLAAVGSAYTFTTKGRVSRALASEFCDRAAEVCK